MKKAFFLLVIIGWISCSKKTDDGFDCSHAVKGDVRVFIKNTASIEEVFALFNKYGLKLKAVYGFVYNSSYPTDSLASLNAYLNTKTYINVGQFPGKAFINNGTRVITFVTSFSGMNPANQHDWINTKNSFSFIDTKSASKELVVSVPPGLENVWIKALRKSDMVNYARPDCDLLTGINTSH